VDGALNSRTIKKSATGVTMETESDSKVGTNVGIVSSSVQVATYIMCSIRWFATDHYILGVPTPKPEGPINKTKEEAVLLRESTLRAAQLDAQAWQALAKIGQGLAIGVGVAAMAYASRPAYTQPGVTYHTYRFAPFNCRAKRLPYSFDSVRISCY